MRAILTYTLCLISAPFLRADMPPEGPQSSEEAVEVGNQKCPVSGKPVDAGSTYTYQGKKYNLCSEECGKAFASDPEKYAQTDGEEAS